MGEPYDRGWEAGYTARQVELEAEVERLRAALELISEDIRYIAARSVARAALTQEDE